MDLHKASLGLLELFRLRTLGRNPSFFSDTITGVCDVTEFYGCDLLSSVAETAAAAAIGPMSSAVAANPRRYLCMQGQVTIGAAAGTFLRLQIGFNHQGVSQALAIATYTPVVGQTFAVTTGKIPGGLVLPPGDFLQLIVLSDAGGVDHVNAMRYTFNVFDGR